MSSIAQLLARKGDIEARRAEEKGKLWGQAVQGLGQAAAGVAQEVALNRREAALSRFLQSDEANDPQRAYTGVLKILGPPGERIARSAAEAAKIAQGTSAANPEEARRSAELMAKGWSDFTPGVRAQLYPGFRQLMAKVGFGFPEQYDESADKGIAAMGGSAPKPIGTRVVVERRPDGSEVQRIVEDRPGQEFVYAPEPAKAPAAGSFEDYLVKRFGASPSPQQIEQARKAYMQADDAPRLPTTLSPGAESNIINRLTSQWDKAAGTTRELARQVRIMDSGLSAARKGDLAAGSQAVLVTFQKILDPTSVVRESEYARSAAGQSLLAQMAGAAERLRAGGAGVPLRELEKYANLAREMAKAQAGQMAASKERIGKTADRYGIPRDLVFEEYDLAGELEGGSSRGTGSTLSPASQAALERLRKKGMR